MKQPKTTENNRNQPKKKKKMKTVKKMKTKKEISIEKDSDIPIKNEIERDRKNAEKEGENATSIPLLKG